MSIWSLFSSPKGERCSEARVLASDLDLALARNDPSVLAPDLAIIQAGFSDPRAGEQIAAAIELKKRLIQGYSVAQLLPFVDNLRDRRAALLGQAPPMPQALGPGATPAPAPAQAVVLAEAESLLDRMKVDYGFVSERDARVARIQWCSILLLTATFAGLGVILIVWLVAKSSSANAAELMSFNSFLNYAILVVVAAAGGVISVFQRSQKQATSAGVADPIVQISALRHGAIGVLVAGLVGPTLAILLVPIFAGGMFSLGDLTPVFQKAPCTVALSNFSVIDHCVWLAPTDSAKMLVWAFLAGFSERLVPDVLDRFVGKAAGH